MESRVACTACGKWMFHLAQTCPHCGVPRAGAKPAPVVAAPQPKGPPKKLELTPEEARSLLAASAPSTEPRMRDVVANLMLPRGGGADLVLSLLAMPVTTLTVVVLGYGVLQTMRKKLPVNLRAALWLAVPTSAAFAAVLLWQNDAPLGVWVALGLSLGAWLTRDLLRAHRRPDPLA